MKQPTEAALRALYGGKRDTISMQRERYARIGDAFEKQYPRQNDVRFFSASGRAEIGGNHTDHQSGRVLAAAVDLDTIAAVAATDTMTVRLLSEGFVPIEVDLSSLAVDELLFGTTEAIIRGCAARMQQLGYKIGGFDAVLTSSVFVGSGLSSSAAVEVLICRILDGLYNKGEMPAIQRAQISQYAENVYFGKPSGLMDQMASSVGGIVAIDFETDTPQVTDLVFDFLAKGYTLAVVNTGGSHDDLTDAYAAIRMEMEAVAAKFGQKRLRYVDQQAFEEAIPALRAKVSDRAILRALHFFDENGRVPQMVDALMANDLDTFFALIIASGDSSWKLLQNVWASPTSQPITLALELSRRMLQGRGAWRVHGGGFAGTILAFVPTDMFDTYAARMDAVFGDKACCALNVRADGAMELETE